MAKEHIFRMHFLPGGAVALYEEIMRKDGKRGLWHISTFDGVSPAREHARSLCMEGYKLRLLNTQAHHLKEIESN